MANETYKLFPETLRSLAGPFTGSYQAIGTPLVNPSQIIKFTNNSNVDVTLSWDGVNDHGFIPAGSFTLLDVTTNSETGDAIYIQAKLQFYVKATGGTGSFYIESYFTQ